MTVREQPPICAIPPVHSHLARIHSIVMLPPSSSFKYSIWSISVNAVALVLETFESLNRVRGKRDGFKFRVHRPAAAAHAARALVPWRFLSAPLGCSSSFHLQSDPAGRGLLPQLSSYHLS